MDFALVTKGRKIYNTANNGSVTPGYWETVTTNEGTNRDFNINVKRDPATVFFYQRVNNMSLSQFLNNPWTVTNNTGYPKICWFFTSWSCYDSDEEESLDFESQTIPFILDDGCTVRFDNLINLAKLHPYYNSVNPAIVSGSTFVLMLPFSPPPSGLGSSGLFEPSVRLDGLGDSVMSVHPGNLTEWNNWVGQIRKGKKAFYFYGNEGTPKIPCFWKGPDGQPATFTGGENILALLDTGSQQNQYVAPDGSNTFAHDYSFLVQYSACSFGGNNYPDWDTMRLKNYFNPFPVIGLSFGYLCCFYWDDLGDGYYDGDQTLWNRENNWAKGWKYIPCGFPRTGNWADIINKVREQPFSTTPFSNYGVPVSNAQGIIPKPTYPRPTFDGTVVLFPAIHRANYQQGGYTIIAENYIVEEIVPAE